jgi:hypothetical protein
MILAHTGAHKAGGSTGATHAALAERRAPLVVTAWVLAAVSLALAAPSLRAVGIQDEASFLPGSSPSQRAAGLLRRLIPDDPSLDAGVVVLSRAGGRSPAPKRSHGRGERDPDGVPTQGSGRGKRVRRRASKRASGKSFRAASIVRAPIVTR